MPKLSLRGRPTSVAGWIIGIGIAWFLAVAIQGFCAARNLGPDWLRFDYDLSAQFGNSFGSLSSLLAALAAIGAWRAERFRAAYPDLANIDREIWRYRNDASRSISVIRSGSESRYTFDELALDARETYEIYASVNAGDRERKRRAGGGSSPLFD